MLGVATGDSGQMPRFHRKVRGVSVIGTALACLMMLTGATGIENPLSGLDTRPSNTTCLAGEAPAGEVVFEKVFSQITSYKPFDLRQSPVNSNRWYFITRSGLVYTFLAPSGTPQLVLDLSDRIGALNQSNAYASGGSEQWGLASFAFDPNFATNGYLFVLYNGRQETETATTSYVARYTLSSDNLTFDRQTAKIIISQVQAANIVNHHFGHLAFGPDGYLYIGSGDGSSNATNSLASNPAQNCADLHGKILRIDINTSQAYVIPSDNPFVGNSSCRQEIYARGFRNPWRFSFDSLTGDLWVGDVGRSYAEEVDVVTKGGNYGWPIYEGNRCALSALCTTPGLVPPVYEYLYNSQPGALIGGFVYRGSALPWLAGGYLFTVFQRDELDLLKKSTSTNTWSYQNILSGAGSFSSHFVDKDGEFYAINGYATNPSVKKLVPDVTNTAEASIPSVLSATGCVDPANPRTVTSQAIPYRVMAPLWSDGAEKQRWLALPNDGKIDLTADGDFVFPINSVLIKEFSFGGKPVETRLLKHYTDGSWGGYSYEWRSDLSDADLVASDGKTKTVTTATGSTLSWHYPSRSECFTCHTEAANVVLGPDIPQLNHPSTDTYPQTGRRGNELATWNQVHLFSTALPSMVRDLPSLVDPSNSKAAPILRARSYLHANCAGCHRPGGPTRTDLDFRYSATVSGMNACNVAPAADNLGVAGAMPIVAKSPNLSLVYLRMNRRGANQMPPLGTTVIDTAGVAAISNWIKRADVCTEFSDTDNDGVPDNTDNCLVKSNANQFDGDNDNWGNRCDGDFNKDFIADSADRAVIASKVGATLNALKGATPTWHGQADLNGDGVVDSQDLAIFDTELSGTSPGPSALRK